MSGGFARLRGAARGVVETFFERMGYELVLKNAERAADLADLTAEERDTRETVSGRTMLRAANVAMLCRSVEYLVQNAIPGALVECGVWRGGAVMAMLRTLLRAGDITRDVYLYDTFEGMTKPTDSDVSWKGEEARAIHSARRVGETGSDWARASLDDVQTGVFSVGYPREKIHFVVGKVEETIPKIAPETIALLRLDTDWYESTRHELENLYPRLSRGGVLIIDDYGWWLGSKKATDEYVAAHNLRLLLVRGDVGVRYSVKLDEA